jgi:8-oxo-dGTP pyrophosphatase MutT (NUDIX family)
MHFNDAINNIKNAWDQQLPGEEIQYRLAPKSRLPKEALLKKNDDFRVSCVLILLYPSGTGEIKTMLIKRPPGTGVHGGQIALPGGKSEEKDASLWHTSIRETEEEVGVDEKHIIEIGALTSLFIPVSKFMVYPFVGYTQSKPNFVANPVEVHQLIPTNINDLLKMPVSEKFVETSYGKINAPYYKLGEHEIWGATAMILSEFIEMIEGRVG